MPKFSFFHCFLDFCEIFEKKNLKIKLKNNEVRSNIFAFVVDFGECHFKIFNFDCCIHLYHL